MKRLLWIVAIFFVVGMGSQAFSQTYEVYNKFGTEGLYELQDNGQNTGEKSSGFGGLYNTAFGLINMTYFGAQAEYRLDLANDYQYKDYTLVGSPVKANVWFRPNKHVEMVFGNNFYMALPASFMNVFNEFTPNGWYGKKYFGTSFVWGPVTLGVNVPQLGVENGELSLKMNFGANVNMDSFNVGLNYKGDASSFSIFASFVGVENLYISGGYTYNGYAIGTANGYGDWRKILSNPIVQWNDRYDTSHIINFSGTYRLWRFTFGADLEAALYHAEQNPFYAGGVVIFEIVEDLDFKIDLKYFTEFLNEDDWRNPWNLTIHPRFIFENEKHQIIAGVKIDLHQWLTSSSVASLRSTYLAIPLSWKYKF